MRFGINPTIQTTGRSTDMAITAHDIVPDSPTNNFATLDHLADDGGYANISEGNLRVNGSLNGGTLGCLPATMAIPKTGKWYWEVHVGGVGYEVQLGIYDIGNIDFNNISGIYPASGTSMLGNNNCYVYYFYNGSMYVRGGGATSFGTAYGSGNLIGFLVDSDNLKLLVYRDGVYQNELTVVDSEYVPMVMWREANGRSDLYLNFGQDALFTGATNLPTGAGANTPDNEIGVFAYMPVDSFGNPITNFKALCTANLPDFTPTVTGDTPQDYFKTVLWTGQTTGDDMTWNGTTGTVTVGFQPDFVWWNRRSRSSNQGIMDSIRGLSNRLVTNSTDAAFTSQTDYIQSFDSNGFTILTNGNINEVTSTYVAWCFRAGGAPTADNSNTSGAMTANSVSLNGTLQSSYTPSGSPTIYPKRMSINTDAGFSIVRYTGTGTTGGTVPHGLDKKPDIVIIKNLNSGAVGWNITSLITTPSTVLTADTFNLSNQTGGNLALNSTRATSAYGIDGQISGSGQSHIAYCWHSVEGHSKLGSYTGNGSGDGPFIYCGFRPAFVMLKRTDAANSWVMMDSQRSPYNYADEILWANFSYEETEGTTTTSLDLLSNGFKLRGSDTSINASGGTYLFMAFAEQPFKFSNAR